MTIFEEKMLRIMERMDAKLDETGTSARTPAATTSRTSARFDPYSAENSAQTVKTLKEINDEYEKSLNTIEEIAEANEEKLDSDRVLLEMEKRKLKALKDIAAHHEDILKKASTLSPEYKNSLEDLKKINKQLEDAEKNVETLSKETETLGEKFKKAREAAERLGEEVVDKFLGPFTIRSMWEFEKGMDKIGADLAKATGTGRKFVEQLREQQGLYTKLGMTLDEAGKGYQDLSMGLINFNNQSKTTQNQMFGQLTSLNKLGLGFGAASKNINELSTVLGTTQDKAVSMQKELGLAAESLGMNVNDINTSFISNLNRLSIYGSGAKDQFLRLQTYAKATNVEVGTLTDLTERLSTFEGAGEFAGRINAIANMDLFDVSELVGLEGDEKIKYIIDRFKTAGFDLDDPKMMRVVSQATGMDAAQFRKLANLDEGAMSKMQGGMDEKMAKGEGEIDRMAKESTTQEEIVEATKQSAQNSLSSYFELQKIYNIFQSFNTGVFKFMKDHPLVAAAGGLIASFGGIALMKTAGKKISQWNDKRKARKAARRELDIDTGPDIIRSTSAEAARTTAERIRSETGEAIRRAVTPTTETPPTPADDCITICEDSIAALAEAIGVTAAESGPISPTDGHTEITTESISDLAETAKKIAKGEAGVGDMIGAALKVKDMASSMKGGPSAEHDRPLRGPDTPHTAPHITGPGATHAPSPGGGMKGLLAGFVKDQLKETALGFAREKAMNFAKEHGINEDLAGMAIDTGMEKVAGGGFKGLTGLVRNAGASAAEGGGGGLLSGLRSMGGGLWNGLKGMGKGALNLAKAANPMNLVKTLAEKVGTNGLKGALGSAGKAAGIGAIIEGIMGTIDIAGMLKNEKDPEKLKHDVGKRVLQMGGTVLTSALLTFLTSFVGMPWIGSILGAYVGPMLTNMLDEAFPDLSPSVGGFTLDMLDKIGIKSAASQGGSGAEQEVIPTKDGVISPGGRYMTTGAGQLLSVSPTDTMLAVDLGAAKNKTTTRQDSSRVERLLEELISTIKSSNSTKEIVVKVNEREIGRAAFNQFSPRAAG